MFVVGIYFWAYFLPNVTDPNINTFVKIDLLLYNFEVFVCVFTFLVGESGFTLL